MTTRKLCLYIFLVIFLLFNNTSMGKRKPKRKSILHKLHGKRELIYMPEVLELQKRAPLGRRSHPAKSCRDIFREVPGANSGVYWFDIVDKDNRTRQVQLYCKKGDYFEEPNGTFPPENLNAGKAKTEPYDWEELHRESWPRPIDPPDEETMDKKIKQALNDNNAQDPGTKQNEIDSKGSNGAKSEQNDPISLNVSNIINNDKPAKTTGIKIVHSKTNSKGKRSGIRITVLKMKKINSFASKRGNLNNTQNKTNPSNITAPKSSSKSFTGIKVVKSHRKTGNQSVLDRGQVLKPVSTSMSGTVVKEISVTSGLTDLPQATGRNDIADDEIQSSVILELNRKSKIAQTNVSRGNSSRRNEDLIKEVTHPSIESNANSSKSSANSSRKDRVVNETLPREEAEINRESQQAAVTVPITDTEGKEYHQMENNTITDSDSAAGGTVAVGISNPVGGNGTTEDNSAEANNTAAAADNKAGGNTETHNGTTDDDQLQHHNWPGQINDVLKKLQINVSDEKTSNYGEPLAFRPGKGLSGESNDGPDYISNSTWPNEVGDMVANVTRDLMKQADLAKEYGSAEEFFSRLLSGEDGAISLPQNNQTSNGTEDYAEQLIPYDREEEPPTTANNSMSWNYNSTKGLTIAESNSIWDNVDTSDLTTKEINEALNSIPFASYQTRIKRQLDHM